MTAPARRVLVRSMTERGLSERHALAVMGMSASALRYTPAPDRNAALRARIIALAHRHRRYGAGMMQVRFEGFSPFLRSLPRPIGHIGILATHVFHDPVHDAEIVLNFGSTREMVRSFGTLIEIERALQRVSR